jgi:hypothetical protein
VTFVISHITVLEFIGQIMGRIAPLFDVMNAAAKTEPDIAALLERLLQERMMA